MYKYGPYGEPKTAANGDSWTGPSSGSSRFRYTGQTMIPEAHLYYYKARVYDPVYGRFLQTDPVGSADDIDLYAYVGGDPVNSTDGSGLMSDGGSMMPESCNSYSNISFSCESNTSVGGGYEVPAGNALGSSTVYGANFGDGDSDGITVPSPFPGLTIGSDSLAQAMQDAWDDIPVKIWVTYTRTNDITNEVYSGRTSFWSTKGAWRSWPGEAQEAAAQGSVNNRIGQRDHRAKSDAGYAPGVLDRWSEGVDGYAQIRGREQMLIDFHGGAKSDGGTSGNPIRGTQKGFKTGFYVPMAIIRFGWLPNNNPNAGN